MAVTSALIFLVCFACLSLLNQDASGQDQSSQLLPLVLNATEPYLITGNIQRLRPELEQLVLGTSIERVDIHGADSLLLASIRNTDVTQPAAASLKEFSSAIVLDDALAATIILQEHLAATQARTWPNLLISFACALAAAIAMLLFNTLRGNPTQIPLTTPKFRTETQKGLDQQESPEVSEETDEEPLALPPFDRNPKGHQRLVMLIRLSDMKDQLVRSDEVDNYMERVWRITGRMAEAYGISCIGIQSGSVVFTASGTNSAVALRHCIMFGWNLCRPEKSRSEKSRPENSRSNVPASLIAPIDFMGENPCHTLALTSNEGLLSLMDQLEKLPEGEFRVCESLKDQLPKSVDAIQVDNNNLRILSIETRMLDLWKQQTQLQ